MTEQHPTANELEGYVIGAHEPADARAIEAHVARCPACATALAREARLEIQLHEVASASPVAAADHRRGRVVAVIGAVGVLAAAAALLVLLPPRASQAPRDEQPFARGAESSPRTVTEPSEPHQEEPPAPGGAVACLDLSSTKQCMRDAFRRGLAVIYPTIQVPHYEYAAAEQLR